MQAITGFFATIIGYPVQWIYSVINNYGITIIIVTIIVRVCLIPLYAKQMKNSAKMAAMQSKQKEIQARYANDRVKMNEEMQAAFLSCGFDSSRVKVVVSNRPDLCEYQCNGAMACAKQAKRKPLDIAAEVAEKLRDSRLFSEAAVCPPGFINLKVRPEALADSLRSMEAEPQYGIRKETPKQGSGSAA